MLALPSLSLLSPRIATGAILTLSLVCASCGQKESHNSRLAVISPDEALAQLGLKSSGEDGLSWASQSGQEGDYSFSDIHIELAEQDQSVTVETLTLSGVSMEGEQAVFSVMQARNISLVNAQSDVSTKIKQLTLTEPSSQTALAVRDVLSSASNLQPSFEQMEFSKLGIEGISILGAGQSVSIEAVSFEDVAQGRAGVISLDGLALDRDGTSNLSLGALSLGAVDLARLSSSNGPVDLIDDARPQSAFAAYNPYKPGVEDITLNDLNFSLAGVEGNLSRFTQTADTASKIKTLTQSMDPLIVSFTDDVGPGQFLRGLGYEQLEIDYEGVTELDEGKDLVSLKQAQLSLMDGFDLSLDYAVEGYAAALEANALIDGQDDDAEMTRYRNIIDGLTVHRAGVTLNDHGFTERAIGLYAQLNGAPVDRVKSQLTGGLLMYSMFLQDDAKSKITREAIEAVTQFIQEPGVLKLGFYPPSPIPLSELEALGTGGEVSDALGFTASTQ